MKLSIRPLGVNGAFTVKGFNTAYLVSNDNGKFLFDCGPTAAISLEKCGHSLSDISDLYISHLHLDHVGGLVQLGISRFVQRRERPRLWCHSSIARLLWSGCLEVFMGRAPNPEGGVAKVGLEDLFEVHPFEDQTQKFDQRVQIGGIDCVPVRVEHPGLSECYGLVIGNKVFVTSDTVFVPELLERVSNTFPLEAIFHHCTFDDSRRAIHAPVSELRTLPEDLKESIFLAHYEDLYLGKNDPEFRLAEAGKSYDF